VIAFFEPVPVTSRDSKWVHLYAGDDATTTICGQPIDLSRWTVRAREHVTAGTWCQRCREREVR
jgi:hypothetical protein